MSGTKGKSLYEQLVAIEHERWADYVAEWKRQIAASYAELSEAEKDANRGEDNRYRSLPTTVEAR